LICLNQAEDMQEIPNVIKLSRTWKSGVIDTCKNYLEFNKSIRTINPNIIILNCELPELYGAMLLKKSKIICVEHTTRPWKGKKLLGIIVRVFLKCKKVGWVTVINKQHKIWFGGRVLAFLPNPYIRYPRGQGNSKKGADLTFVGGLKPNKRPEWVIETGLRLGLSVQLFGTGVLRPHLENKYLENSDQIKFYGFLSNPWNSISSNSLVIVPSDYEGDGMVVVEAVISGNPILLRNNMDLRRFEFEDKHFFNDLDELTTIVSKNTKSRFKNLVVSKSSTLNLEADRSLQKITNAWLRLICSQ